MIYLACVAERGNIYNGRRIIFFMRRRVVFDSEINRERFFKKVLESVDLKKWSDLRKYFGIPKSMLEFYKNGKLTLPEVLYLCLSKHLEDEDKRFFETHITFLCSDWGKVKGGKVTYLRHKNIFDEGRKKAISFMVKKADERFDGNMALNRELAYFIGLFIGDGFTNKYKGNYLVQFTGDKKEECFYKTLISGYSKELFNMAPKIKDDRVANAIRINLYSKTLFNMITQRFKISAGRKSHSVLIPKEILDSKSEIIKSCIRGLYDAEGCVFFDKRKEYKKLYPRIELHMCNLALLKQVSTILTKFGIYNIVGENIGNLRVTIWGFEEVKKFMKEIGFSNQKQLGKLCSAGLV